MNYNAHDVTTYIEALPDARKIVIKKLRKVIQDNLPKGFEETFQYNMISYVVPLSIYPDGYHVKEGEPLPFLSLASQKNYISLYHMGIYMNEAVNSWFVKAYAERVTQKLDMGKSCIRFKKIDQIPFDLIGELCRKISVDDHIKAYEQNKP